MDLDSRHLRALVAVVDEGTFTDAAIALGVSQASVSRSVQHLEAALGARLLDRSSRHVAPTETGRRVLVPARRLLETLGQLEQAARPVEGDLSVGYAWAALGRHTVAVQRTWAGRGTGDLVFVHTNTPTAGLLEGRCQVSVVRREATDPRLETAVVGRERRYAVVASDHELADRAALRLVDLAGQVVALDVETGTTSAGLWQADAAPGGFRLVHGVDEWLTLIASGRAVGVSSAATADQHPRPGVRYLPVEDAEPITVWLAWWRDEPPAGVDELVSTARTAYGEDRG